MPNKFNKMFIAAIAAFAIGAFQHASAQNQAVETLNVHCKDFATIGFNQSGSGNASSSSDNGAGADQADIDLYTTQDYLDVATATGKSVTKPHELLVRATGGFSVAAQIAGDLTLVGGANGDPVIPASDVFINIANPVAADQGGTVSQTVDGAANGKNFDFTGTGANAGVLTGTGTTGTLFDVTYGIHNLQNAVNVLKITNPESVYTTTITYTLTAN